MSKVEFKTTVDYVTSVHRFNLNIISRKLLHKNINKQMDIDAFDLQKYKKSGENVLYYNVFNPLILTTEIVIYCLSSL